MRKDQLVGDSRPAPDVEQCAAPRSSDMPRDQLEEQPDLHGGEEVQALAAEGGGALHRQAIAGRVVVEVDAHAPTSPNAGTKSASSGTPAICGAATTARWREGPVSTTPWRASTM